MPLQGEAKREYQRDYMRARRSKKTTGIDGKITHPKKIAFLQNYPRIKGIVATCEAIGIDPKTYYNWCNADKLFLQEVQRVKKEVDDRRLQLYEAELDKRVMFGSKQSDILLMFGLKALNPEKYRERPPETRLIGDITVKLAVPAYTDNPVLPPAKQLPAKSIKEGDNG